MSVERPQGWTIRKVMVGVGGGNIHARSGD